jgi:hypothetical protein
MPDLQSEPAPTMTAPTDVPGPLPCASNDDEPMGGDPPCWAHLFEDEDTTPAG